MTAPRASVLICTHNRERLLADCLETMLVDRSIVSREVVIVDNASSDGTQAVIRSFAARSPHAVRHLVEPRLGTAHARNTAVEAARGELLLLADDDVLVCDGWADALVRGFDDPGVVVSAGRVVPRWPSPPPAWLDGPHAEILTSKDRGPEPRLLAANDVPPALNLAVRADAARSSEPPFDARLGHAGAVRLSNEDGLFVQRLRALGSVAYRPDALVQHVIEPYRIDLGWMRTAYFHHGIGLARMARLEGQSLPSLPSRLLRAARAVRRAVEARRLAQERPRVGPETWDELYALVWAGHAVEQLVGRSGRLSKWVVEHGV